jgi:hypothetical protein
MRKLIVVIVLIAFTGIRANAQISFERGYFIDESNQKIECLIRNIGWKSNPTEFEYMLSENADIQKATIQNVKEFGIYDKAKYVRSRVKIDRSSDKIDYLGTERNPTFQEELLFLKLLIEGEASLFLYADGDLTRLFYQLNGSEISPLVYKRYIVDDNKLAYNNYFRQQLFLDLQCHGVSMNDVNNIRYNPREVKRIFVKYNECTHSSYINYEEKQKKDVINMSLRPGLHYSSLAIHNSLTESHNTDFGNKMGLSFGIETEFILPYYNNKWAITIEPTLQYYKSEQIKEVSNVSGGILVSEVNYRSVELPAGVRHYFYINDKSKIFVNLSFIWDFANNSTIEFTRHDGSVFDLLNIKSRHNLSFGSGYKHNDVYSIEMRYQTNRDILGNYYFWFSEYKTFSIIFGYSLF